MGHVGVVGIGVTADGHIPPEFRADGRTTKARGTGQRVHGPLHGDPATSIYVDDSGHRDGRLRRVCSTTSTSCLREEKQHDRHSQVVAVTGAEQRIGERPPPTCHRRHSCS